MVNLGRPSGGCHACRKRKVKCDEQKPACSRCTLRQMKCPGYRDDATVIFQNQNSWAQEKVRKRIAKSQSSSKAFLGPSTSLARFKSSSPFESSRDGDDATIACSILGPGEGQPNLLSQPFVDPSIFAINRFYSEYVVTAGFMPFLSFVPDMYAQHEQLPCFHHALPAVALASAAKQTRKRDLMLIAHTRYGHAVNALNRALKDPLLAQSDEVVASVLMLGIFEIIAREDFPENSWDSHYHGRIALLKMRGPKQLDTQVGRCLFLMMHNQLLINSFLGRAPPQSILTPAYGQGRPDDDWHNVLCYGRILHRAASCSARLSSAVEALRTARMRGGIDTRWNEESSSAQSIEEVECRSNVMSLIGEGLALDDKMENGPSTYLPKRTCAPEGEWIEDWLQAHDVTEGEWTIVHGAVALCRTPDGKRWTNVGGHVTSNQSRAVRIHLLEAMIEAGEALDPAPSATDMASLVARWKLLSRQLAQEIWETVGILLGPLDENDMPKLQMTAAVALKGYGLVWPLNAALTSHGQDEAFRRKVSRIIRYIGDALGLQKATAIARLTYYLDVPDRIKAIRSSVPVLEEQPPVSCFAKSTI